jgi:PAS domain-containing protein
MDQSWDLSLRSLARGEILTLASTSPILRDGKVVGCLAMFTDVTERTRAERALRRSDEQSRLLTEALPQIVNVACA